MTDPSRAESGRRLGEMLSWTEEQGVQQPSTPQRQGRLYQKTGATASNAEPDGEERRGRAAADVAGATKAEPMPARWPQGPEGCDSAPGRSQLSEAASKLPDVN